MREEKETCSLQRHNDSSNSREILTSLVEVDSAGDDLFHEPELDLPPDFLCKSAEKEMSLSNEDSEDDDDDDDNNSSSSESSSSSSEEESDSTSKVDQTEIDLRNKLLKNRQVFLLKCNESVFSSAEGLSSITKELPQEDDKTPQNEVIEMANKLESSFQSNDEPIDELDSILLNLGSPKEEDKLVECKHDNNNKDTTTLPLDFAQKSNENDSKKLNLLAKDKQVLISEPLQNSLKIKTNEFLLKTKPILLLKNNNVAFEKEINSNTGKDTLKSDSSKLQPTRSQKSQASAATLMKSLKDAKLKTKIMRGEHRKQLKKQIEEEIKKKK